MKETSTRDRIRALVIQYPGLHLREVARQLDMSIALVQYHLPGLVEAGLVEVHEDGGIARLFPPRLEVDEATLTALRDRKRLHIVLTLMDRGPLRHAELCQATAMGKSTLSFHLQRLEEAGVVRRDDGAITLCQPEAIRVLLEKHRPTPDLVDRFARVWGDLYG